MSQQMKVAVVGTGYVGLSLSVLISRKHDVTAVDIVQEKIDLIKSGKSPIKDNEIEFFLSDGKLSLDATADLPECKGSDFIIVATPTNYDTDTNRFDTSSVESVIASLEKITPESTIVIKSTVPIGFTESFVKEHGYANIIFSPEFLREGKALYDNLYPSRIIVGVPLSEDNLRRKAIQFANLLADCSEKPEVETLIMGSTEAESVKLFSNTYLAMRVSFFNELDTYAERNGLSAKEIIDGVCMDPRIGNDYNNPSFGYGGYCLPKDTKQLLSNYTAVPNRLIEAIVSSNDVRKRFVADTVEQKTEKKDATVGIYRLVMKSGSDNFRESSVFDIMKMIRADGYDVIVYEPTVKTEEYNGWRIVNDLDLFRNTSDIILANRFGSELGCVKEKVFCRDIFNRD